MKIDAIELPSDNEDVILESIAVENSSTSRSLNQVARKDRMLSPLATRVAGKLDVVLCIPRESTWVPIDDLPSPTKIEIKELYATKTCKPHREKDYDQMLRNYRCYLNNERCINNRVNRKSSAEFTFVLAVEDKKRACDQCIKQGCLCARLIEEGDMVKVGLYPLPIAFRDTVDWTELSFWVMQ
jgi:hypothetical protein